MVHRLCDDADLVLEQAEAGRGKVEAWNAARRDEQFKRALASRDIIGQANGMIMERHGVDAVRRSNCCVSCPRFRVPLMQIV